MAIGKIVIKASLCALLAAGTLTASAEEAGKVDADTLAQMEALVRQLAEDSLSQRDKGARAIVNGNLLLRDAKYRYHELATEAGNPLIFMSHDCDVYQIVMTGEPWCCHSGDRRIQPRKRDAGCPAHLPGQTGGRGPACLRIPCTRTARTRYLPSRMAILSAIPNPLK